MNIFVPLFAIFVMVSPLLKAAPSIRMPRLPAGLSADKKAVPINKLAKPNLTKPVERKFAKAKRKGLTHLQVRHTFSHMTYDELKVAKRRCIEAKNIEIAAKYIERMITLCEDVKEKATLIIDLADLFYEQKEFDTAKKWYLEFVQLYPGNQSIEKAKRNIILCTKERILTPDRDQSPTEETLKLSQEYLDKDSYSTYRDEISKIKKECETILAQADCNVAEFYIKRGDYSSAERRVKHIRTAWLEKVPQMSTTLAQLEVHLGTEWKEFEIPKESIQLAQTAMPVRSSRKVNMATRF